MLVRFAASVLGRQATQKDMRKNVIRRRSYCSEQDKTEALTRFNAMFQPLLPAFHHLTMLCVMETTDVCMLALTGVQNVHVIHNLELVTNDH